MSAKPPSALAKAWFKWKALRLPWRKRYLVGLDLQGNSFWEFHDALSTDKHRMRRIVQYPPSTHYSEIKISPQWHQWLRHTRHEPPSIVEQSQDLVRQRNLKVLAARADARWAAKPSFLDQPERRQSVPPLESHNAGGAGELSSGLGKQTQTTAANGDGRGEENVADVTRQPQEEEERPKEERKKKEDPWTHTRGGPSEEWQPQAWTGDVAARR